jgi:hypothetical protein
MATGGGVNGVIATGTITAGAISLVRIGGWTVEIVGDAVGAVIAIGDTVIGANLGAVSVGGDAGLNTGDGATSPVVKGCAFSKICGATTG